MKDEKDETRLIHDYLTGEATDEECRCLEAWMRQEGGHVDQFVHEAFLHRALHEVCREIVPAPGDVGDGSSGAPRAGAAPLALPELDPLGGEDLPAERDATGGSSAFRVWPGGFHAWFLSGLVVLLVAGLGTWVYWNRYLNSPPGAAGPVAVKPSQATVAALDEMGECVWATSPVGLAKPPARVSPGDVLNLRRGSATVRFDCGAVVRLKGPAMLVIDTPMDATLLAGDLSVNVPEEARGFLVHTGDMDVRDLGTEFDLNVDEAGQTRVDVVEGQVEASLPRKELGPKIKRNLRMGEFLRTGRSVPSAEPGAQRLSVFRGVRLNFATPEPLRLLTIVGENKDHYRHDPVGGCLSIDTTWGNIWGRDKEQPGENLFLLPAPEDADFDVVLSVARFVPERFCEQIGLVMMNDYDNYARIIYARNWRSQQQYVQFNVEANGGCGSRDTRPVDFQSSAFQLRLVRRGSEVSGWWSRDGKHWELRDRGRAPGVVRYVGFYASKGHPYPKDGTPCRQALIEQFEIDIKEMNDGVPPVAAGR